MKTHIAAALALSAAIILFGPSAGATKPAPPPDKPTAAETPFVSRATAELQKMYGTTAAAAAAGYFQYTDEDSTGAISWINTKYWTSDETHPSQLWYDVKGRLIGVDYAVPKGTTKVGPSKWGILPARWFEFEAHVHYAVKNAMGAITYNYLLTGQVTKVGGSPMHPTAADVVKIGKAKSTSDVLFTFAFPDVWDLEFWVVPNPKGVFATKNPAVIPSAKAEKQM